MTHAVSIVIPCLDDKDLLATNLPPLLAECERRAQKDEVIIVDDTGRDVLAEWVAREFPTCRVLVQVKNGGFAQALLAGVEGAAHEFVFCMNPDVRVRDGFLDPLVACASDPEVFAVAPRVLLDGDEERIESITELSLTDSGLEIVQPGLAEGASLDIGRPRPIVFAVGGTSLVRRADFLADGGMDPLYEPFYLEDLDQCFTAWRNGRKVLYQPASVVEHHHRGTIGKLVEQDYVRAVIEKNRVLFQWKFLEGRDVLDDHVASLYRQILDAWLSDAREELVWLNLAFDQLEDALAARERLGEPARSVAEILAESSD